MSTLKVNTLQNTSGVEVYTCKAWVNFNGSGTVAIRGSGNVSSITDNGTGNYDINFTTAMPDANYSPVFVSGLQSSATTSDLASASTVLADSFRVITRTAGTTTGVNADVIACAVFR